MVSFQSNDFVSEIIWDPIEIGARARVPRGSHPRSLRCCHIGLGRGRQNAGASSGASSVSVFSVFYRSTAKNEPKHEAPVSSLIPRLTGARTKGGGGVRESSPPRAHLSRSFAQQ